jgi:HNH endonuclease
LPAESSSIKNGPVAEDIYQNLLRILRYESKDTTYKFALLRGLIEISSESPHIKAETEYVTAPFGLLVEKWVQYYWPIIEQDIPQKHGGEKTKPLAFRRIFKTLTDVYSRKGGFTQFRHDYHNGRLSQPDEARYLAVLRELRRTIALMPMKHLGQSVFKGLYRLVKHPVLSNLPALSPGQLTPGWVVQNFGDFEFRRDYHEAFQKIGGLLLGTDAILYHWADFTARIQKDSATPEAFHKIFQTLTKTYEEDRQVKDAKQCYLDAMQKAPVYCVWCKISLSAQNLAIDHVLPFSQTQNNNLWNLMPTCKKCNSLKSDSIPTPKVLQQRNDLILKSWQLEHRDHPEAFEQEIRYDLVGFDDKPFVAETALQYLSKRCDFLIKERGYDPWERN